EGAELWPTTPEAPMSVLYSSTSRREITSVVSHRVPGRFRTTEFLPRNTPDATLAYELVSEGISPILMTRRFSGCGVDWTILSSCIIYLPLTVRIRAMWCR